MRDAALRQQAMVAQTPGHPTGADRALGPLAAVSAGQHRLGSTLGEGGLQVGIDQVMTCEGCSNSLFQEGAGYLRTRNRRGSIGTSNTDKGVRIPGCTQTGFRGLHPSWNQQGRRSHIARMRDQAPMLLRSHGHSRSGALASVKGLLAPQEEQGLEVKETGMQKG